MLNIILKYSNNNRMQAFTALEKSTMFEIDRRLTNEGMKGEP